MSLYQYKLKKEIKHYQISILRNINNINSLKEDLAEEYYINYKAHIDLIKQFSNDNIRIKERLRKVKRLVH